MNIKNSKIEELVSLVASFDDNMCSHIVWVDHSGEVKIQKLIDQFPPEWEEANQAFIKFRLETFHQGLGYVGQSASVDAEWMKQLHYALVRHWKEGSTGYVDDF